MTWMDSIPTLDPDDFAAIDAGDFDQLGTAEYSTGVYGEAINIDAAVRVKLPVHHVRDVTGITSMTQAIGSLPSQDEAVHLWIGGRHSMGHVIPAIAELAAPATIDAVVIATLTFSKDNASEWAALIDAGKIKSLTILCSHYFKHTSTGIYEYANEILTPRGAEIVTARCHAKLAAVKLSDGRTVTAEGSANTRSCRTLEQVTIFGNPEVYRFHVAQIGRAARAKTDRNLQE